MTLPQSHWQMQGVGEGSTVGIRAIPKRNQNARTCVQSHDWHWDFFKLILLQSSIPIGKAVLLLLLMWGPRLMTNSI